MGLRVAKRSRGDLAARLHPLLFAAYPILYMWSANPQEGNSLDVAVLLSISLVGALLGVEILRRLVFRSVDKAATATTAAALAFFNYGSLYDSLHEAGLSIGRHRHLLPITCLTLLTLWVWLVRRPESKGLRSTTFVSLGAVLVMLALGRLFVGSTTTSGLVPPVEEGWIEALAHAPQPRPDIYYLILDGYTRQDQLETVFGFSNAAFLEALEQRGFSVASQSRSNYGYTIASLASSLNFSHLDESLGFEPESGVDDRVVRELVRNNRVFRLLGHAGYTRHVIDRRVDFSPSEDPPEVLTDCGSSGEFIEAFLQTTAARVVRSRWGGFTAGKRRQVTLCQFEALASAVEDPGPKFVYFHSLITHPPFLFERDGSERPVRDVVARKWRPWLPRESYVDQIVVVNRFVLGVIDDILQRSGDAIIVLQGDHGSVTSPDPPSHRSPPDQLEQRFAILNALRIPDAGQEAISETISPVNTFPVILRERFGVPIGDRENASFLRFGLDGVFREIDFAPMAPAHRTDPIDQPEDLDRAQ